MVVLVVVVLVVRRRSVASELQLNRTSSECVTWPFRSEREREREWEGGEWRVCE